MRGLFSPRPTPGRTGKLKEWVTARLELTDADLVTVAELACHEPGCPPVETIVTVHHADGVRRNWRVHMPIAEIGEEDVGQALFIEAGY